MCVCVCPRLTYIVFFSHLAGLPSQIAPSCVESHHVDRSFDAAGGATPGESPAGTSDGWDFSQLPRKKKKKHKKTMGSIGKP